MKKSCAVKFLAMMLVIAMVMSVSLSAMALTATSTVQYTGDVAKVTTSISDLDAKATMVTYMVTDNAEVATVTDSQILYIDQKDKADATANGFKHSIAADKVKTAKFFVGADAGETPVEGTIAGATVVVDEMDVTTLNIGLTANNNTDVTEIHLGAIDSATVKNVTINEDAVETWFVGGANSIWVVGAFGIGDTIAVTTGGSAPTGDAVVTLGKVTLEGTSIIAFAHVEGKYGVAGIEIGGVKYPAVAFGDGAFAVEVVNESGWNTTSGIIVKAYADEVYSKNNITTTTDSSYTYPVVGGVVTIN